MSRSGYSEDCENVALWRGAVRRAIRGTFLAGQARALRHPSTISLRRARAARAMIEARGSRPAMVLAGFMAVVEGRNLTEREATKMLS